MQWTDELRETFQALRDECEAWVWSRGVELARGGLVRLVRDCPAEVSFLVESRDGKPASQVDVLPADAEWTCDCGSRASACMHVAASLIAYKRAVDEKTSLDGAKGGHNGAAKGRVVYVFSVVGREIHWARFVKTEDSQSSLAVRLGSAQPPTNVIITREDIEAEIAVGQHARAGLDGLISRDSWPALVRALQGVEGMLLDGRPVRLSAVPCSTRVVVVDDGPGVLVRGERDMPAGTVYSNGVVWLDGVLHPLVSLKLPADLQDLLARGRVFYPRDYDQLVSELLPRFEGLASVNVRTNRLPRRTTVKPRLLLTMSHENAGEGLRVVADVVYGDPAVARVVDGRLVMDGSTVPVRDVAEELRLKDLLWRDLSLEPGRSMSFFGDQAVRFSERVEKWRQQSPSVGMVAGDAARSFDKHQVLTPVVMLNSSGTLGVRFGAGVGQDGAPREAPVDRVFAAWRAGENFVPLLGGGVAPLPRAWLERFGGRLRDLLASRDTGGRVPKVLWNDTAAFAEDAGIPVPEAMAELRRRLTLVAESDATPVLPADLHAELRPYQLTGVSWLQRLRDAGLGALLADDMGLGKTLQTIAAMYGKVLVVAPTSLLFNWREEIARFRPSLRVHTFHGPQRTWDSGADVVLTSYALLRMEFSRLSSRTWDVLVLDEAQQIRNSDSQAAQAACQIKASWRVALTGTPVENRLDDLWSLFRFLGPGLLGERKVFQDVFVKPVLAGDAGASGRLRDRIRPYVMRRMKSEVAKDLPERTDMTIHVDLSEDERGLYDALWATTRREALELLDAERGMIQVLELLLRLRQAACHPALLPGAGGRAVAGPSGGSSKTKVLLEMLQTAVEEGHKALVYSQWTSLLDLIEPDLRSAGIAFTRLDGSTVDRQGVVGKFQSEDGPPVMLLSLKAGGVGLNLTRADHVFLMDPWWNPAIEEQAVGRAHRIGQKRPVMLWRLVAQDTVETRILELQEHKRGLVEAALGGGSTPTSASALTVHDLRALLS